MEEAGFDSHKSFARAVLEESQRAGEPLSPIAAELDDFEAGG